MAEKKKSTPSRKRAPKAPVEATSMVLADTAEHLPAVVEQAVHPPEAVKAATLEPVAPPARPSHDAVQRRAFELHQARGGSAFENWLQAERELHRA